ncbi:nucleotidyltransferase family protein [Streptomyces sp. P1-3]|uniref:nucleotidyltransferase family protein n=1 Tax=Streptomyces sp. P1-3 TaxID=3421658 RepID=UPI003D363A7E
MRRDSGEPGRSAVRQGVVLAGGYGRRLRPLTCDRPKAMVEVRGTPILRHQIDWFAESGVERVIVSAGYLATVISDYLGSRELPLRAEVVVEERPLGRGGGLKRAARVLPYPDEPWLAAYGDIWTSFSLSDMCAHHERHAALATVALARAGAPRAGVECDERGRVTSLASAGSPRPRVNAGIYLLAPEAVDLLPDEGDHVQSTLAHLIRTRQLMGYPVDAPWRAVNTPQDLAELERELAKPRSARTA